MSRVYSTMIADSFREFKEASLPTDKVVVIDPAADGNYLWVYKRLPKDNYSTELGREIIVDEGKTRWRLGLRTFLSDKGYRPPFEILKEKTINAIDKMEEFCDSNPENIYNVIRPESFGTINPYEDCSAVIKKMLDMTTFLTTTLVFLTGRYFIDGNIDFSLYEDRTIVFLSAVNSSELNSVFNFYKRLTTERIDKKEIDIFMESVRPTIYVGENASLSYKDSDHVMTLQFNDILIKMANKIGNKFIKTTESVREQPPTLEIRQSNTYLIIDEAQQ